MRLRVAIGTAALATVVATVGTTVTTLAVADASGVGWSAPGCATCPSAGGGQLHTDRSLRR